MATSDAAVIDVQLSEEKNDAESALQFQDFGVGTSAGSMSRSTTKEQIHNFTEFPDTPGSEDDDTETLLRESQPSGKARHSFWSFAYYQDFFDVDTHQVLQRIIWSMIPNPKMNYLQKYIRPNPDLYGPFWICATLVFSTAISGNLTNYLYVANAGTYEWRYDFHKVSIAATTVYLYASLVPLALWCVLWYRKIESGYTLLELLCVYGYSLAIYVPISVIWVIHASWLQWMLVIIGSALSGSVLLQVTWPAFKEEQKKVTFLVMIVMLGLHFLLAAGFVVYFFDVPQPTMLDVKTTSIILTTEAIQQSPNATIT